MKINRPKLNKKTFLISIGIVLVILGGYGAYALSAEKWPFSPSPEEQAAKREELFGSGDTTPDPNTPQSPSQSDSSNSGSISNSKGSDDSSVSNIDSDVTPHKPSGTFVSNHHPNLSGHPAPNSMSSTCTTTPGAKCLIRFTMNEMVKTLPAKTTNGSGNVSWEWKLQDIGLSAGDWKVTAVASNGSKTAEVSDPMLLSVQE